MGIYWRVFELGCDTLFLKDAVLVKDYGGVCGGTAEQTIQLGGCHQVRYVGGLGWSEVAEFKMYFDGRQDGICVCIRCWG